MALATELMLEPLAGMLSGAPSWELSHQGASSGSRPVVAPRAVDEEEEGEEEEKKEKDDDDAIDDDDLDILVEPIAPIEQVDDFEEDDFDDDFDDDFEEEFDDDELSDDDGPIPTIETDDDADDDFDED